MASAAKRLAALGLCALVALLPVPPAFAGPSGEVVVEGDATFSRPDDQTTIIDTTTQSTIVQYDSFDILPGELVKINQPTDTSKIINHVPVGDATQIGGQLQSNGYVYIVNPAGVFLGDTAMIDVGGLVAAAGRISYDEFLAGQDHFTELGGEVVVADGALVRADDTVALIGQRVANYGTIISQGGMVAFIAGSEAVLGSLDGRMIVHVDGGDAGSPIADDQFALTQAGEVDAGSGRVLLTAGDTYSLAMNHTGITRGREIELHAQNDGLVQVAGTLDASGRGDGETGGRIEVTGDRIAVMDGARLDASGDAGGGEIRVGGDVQGGGVLRAASRTYVASTAELVADAITAGDGGSIVVWSEEKTGFYGGASARGGALGGDGGFIEISGRQSLEARGQRVDLSAPFGQSGTLLYDPDRIVIVGGGPTDGDDADDLGDTLEGGVLGRILDGDATLIDPFFVYESEIEGTDANIILQATTSITIDELSTFDNPGNGSGVNEIFLVPGNSLVIQTTGDGPDTGFAIDLGENLTWRVDDGGVIDIRTSSGNPGDVANSARGDIRVGHLVFGGREFFTDPDTGFSNPRVITADAELIPFGLESNTGEDGLAVNIQSEVGDIIVGSITASGSNAVPRTNPDDPYRFASSGGNVAVNTVSGQVTVGWVESTGGSAVEALDPADSAPSEGGLGGNVQIESDDGSVWIQDHIHVSGGQGLAGYVASSDPDLQDDVVGGVGGDGGQIVLTALGQGDTIPFVTVTGDLQANGGAGTGEVGLDTSSGTIPLSGSGGSSGRIDIASTGGIVVQGATLEANGGDGQSDNTFLGTTAGGNSGGAANSTLPAIKLEILAGAETTDEVFDIVLENAQLFANGGNALSGGAGGSGGLGGGILINAFDGSVVASDGVTIQANGGNGAAAAFDGPNARPGFGGNARVITISGNGGAEVGDIESRGGDAANGSGGLGGGVEISSLLGDVQVGNVDVSGGSATRTADHPDLVVNGGAAGGVSLDSRTFDVDDDGVTVPGGDVRIAGRLMGFGGTGLDADGNATVAAGALMDLRSDAAIESAAPGASVEGGQVNLFAPVIGAPGAAIDIAGTTADDDSALLSTSGSLHVNLLPQHGPLGAGGSGFEDVTVRHTDETASSQLDADGMPMLVVNGGAMAGDDVSLAWMQTGAGDPTLNFSLDAVDSGGATGDTPSVIIERNVVQLGDAGGSITNGGGAILGAAGASGTDTHVASTGNVLLDALSIGEAGPGAALRVGGDSQASLAMVAQGDVYVDAVNVAGGGAFGAIDVTQELATGETTIRGLDAGDNELERIQVTDVSVEDPDTMTVLDPRVQITGSTQISDTTLAYRHVGAAPAGGSAPTLQVNALALGGDGLLASSGDLELADTDAASVVLDGAGRDLTLDAGGDIVGADLTGGSPHVQLAAGAPDDPASLVLLAGGSVGTADGGFLVTGDAQRLAAQFGNDFRMRNGGSDLEIAQVQVLAPTDVGGDTVERTVTGILGGSQADDDFELDNGADRIVLGRIPTLDPSTPATHVSVSGSAAFHSPVQVENAQYVLLPTAGDDGLGSELVAVNVARIAAGGDILFAGPLDTGAGSTAVDDITDPMEGTPADDVFVPASLTVVSNGTATYEGDVGAGSPFARFDTTNAVLAGAGGVREIHAVDVVFRGTLDGPAAAVIVGESIALPDDADPSTRVTFGGNVGSRSALAGLDVQADGIQFALAGGGSAEQVNVGDGGISLSTGQTSIPSVATITDTAGNLRFQTSGDFSVGPMDKLSALGELQIAAASVTVGDLSASRIEVDSPDIVVMTRDPGDVELPDGSLVAGGDGGVDWVANDIVATSALTPSDPTKPIALYIGSGGVSVPGGLNAYTVRYASPSLDGIAPSAFVGQDGVVLDLTGFGPPVVGDPTRSLERPADPTLPETWPTFGADAPAAGSQVNALQVLAFLRCSGVSPDQAPGCAAADAAALAGVDRFQDSALATPRAREVTQRYRELLATPGAAQRLRSDFAAAGRAFGATMEWRDGTLDGAAFYRFLESARGSQAEALASMRELAWLFAEIDLLGLADADTRRLQQTLAQEFADAAGLQGFDAAAVTAAVDASPVGLP